MMLKRILIVFPLLMLVLSSVAQTKLIETVKAKKGEIVIPYKKYQLDNGLKVIIHEDHSDPLVHVDVTYHVGSAREELKKSGFAHFFEHMMFQGSENVADEEHFKIITESGGTLNGTTNNDRTNYYETVPVNQLEKMLWLEADRMGFLLPAVTQKKFEVQRATVKNEKGQNYDNQPYGRWTEVNAAALYPYGHPYSWLTIGKLEDLDRVDVNDLKKFFLRWYGPNNAALTIAGDVNASEVIPLVEKYFGSIPSGPKVENMKLPSVVLDKDRYVSYVDSNIRFPAILMSYPTVPVFHPDEAPLDCLSDILGGGKSSYFYQKFVKTQTAIQASVFNNNMELGGSMVLFVLPFPGKELADMEAQIRKALEEFEKDGVKTEDVEKFKAKYESSTINGLATVSGKASKLARYQFLKDNPNLIGKELDRYHAVTKEDVMRVYKKYIKGKFAVIQSVIPNENVKRAAPDNYTPQTEGESDFPKTDYSGLVYKKAKDNFDRSKQPVAGANPLVSVPKIWKTTINGVKVLGTEATEIPVVSMRLNINGGQNLESKMPQKAGIAELTATLMNETTKNYTPEQLSVALQKLGSSISVSADRSSITVSARSLKKNFVETAKLMEEVLRNPLFLQEDFERIKKQQIENIKAAEKEAGAIASQAYRKRLYDKPDVRIYPVSGFEETVSSITLQDVKDFYAKYISPSVSELVIVGDVNKAEAIKAIDFLKNWPTKNVEIEFITKPLSVDKTKIYLFDKSEAPQSEIRIGYVTDLNYDVTGDYFKSQLMNYPLGGAFNSRINLNLREDKGYTYGAGSYFSSYDKPGPWTAYAGVKTITTDSAVFEFMKEIKGYYEKGITLEEVDFMRKSYSQKDARAYEAPWQKASFLNRILHFDLDPNYVKKQAEIVNTVTKKELDQLAKKHLNPNKMNIVIVGDKKTILPGLKRLGYEIIEIDVRGNIIKK